ncbi:polysialoglycoprotein-like isoform X1 [Oryzias melastigma]|uniref:polysialoglycoprotein-like isoform X1 n=1 Tax=Oryzias melastigma TaxID=30732 RepID=UPI000CF81412|nr:polysialoglycoprotein-like isoform X1 [Oryzias melastigma]
MSSSCVSCWINFLSSSCLLGSHSVSDKMGAESVLALFILAVCFSNALSLPVARQSQNADDELLVKDNEILSLSGSLGLLQSMDSSLNKIEEVKLETNEVEAEASLKRTEDDAASNQTVSDAASNQTVSDAASNQTVSDAASNQTVSDAASKFPSVLYLW